MPTHPDQLGPYTICHEIGRGGMGVVYLGHDTRLDRAVAIKTLPEHFAGDPDRLARFEREARTLASLSHPNVAGIYGVEDHEGAKFLILEFVEGETLAERLDRGPLPIDEAIEIAMQIASGVEAAHEAGVVHRDLKPANIKITPEGEVKVLDFGLAKADVGTSTTGSVLSQSPTLTSPVLNSPTIPGAILGTAPYMSPEQARGRSVDKRTDIWSFGVILYEMLTGTGPFHGETVSDSIGAILHLDVDFDRLPKGVPATVRRVLRRCLARDKAERFRDIGDVRLELLESSSHEEVPAGAAAQAKNFGWWSLLVVLLLVTMVWMYFGMQKVPRTERDETVVRFTVEMPSDGYFSLTLDMTNFAVSPDGRHVAFVVQHDDGEAALYVRSLDTLEIRKIEGVSDPRGPVFSPDSRWLAFVDGFEHIVRQSVGGGPIEKIFAISTIDSGIGGSMAWLEDGNILFTDDVNDRLYALDTVSNKAALLNERNTDQEYYGLIGPAETPNPDAIIFDTWTGPRRADNEVWWLNLKTGDVAPLIRNASNSAVVGDRWVLFLRDHSLYATAFDFQRMEAVGESRVVIESLHVNEWSTSSLYAVSTSGVCVHVPGQRLGQGRRLVFTDAAGAMTPAIKTDGAFVNGTAVSSDGKRIASTTLEETTKLWVYDLASGSSERFDISGEVYMPIFSPNDDAIWFISKLDGRDGLGRLDLAMGVVDRTLDDQYVAPMDWAPDGRMLIGIRSETDNSYDLALIDTETGEMEPVCATPAPEWGGRISPDGHWLSYLTQRAGRTDLYVRAFPDGTRDWLVASDSVHEARWAPDGGALSYYSNREAPAVYSRTFSINNKTGTPEFGEERKLFESDSLGIENHFTVMPDGRFLMIAVAPWELERPPLHVTLNFEAYLRSLFE